MAHVTYHWKRKVFTLLHLSHKLKARGVKGASHSNLTRIFAGRHNPRYELALAIADVMGMDLQEFSEMLKFCRKLNAKAKKGERVVRGRAVWPGKPGDYYTKNNEVESGALE